ncbi:MAG: hypothetical protein ACRDLB_04190 [Actinomycetota bacterium]
MSSKTWKGIATKVIPLPMNETTLPVQRRRKSGDALERREVESDGAEASAPTRPDGRAGRLGGVLHSVRGATALERSQRARPDVV